MMRVELIRKERARGRVYGYAFWILGFVVVGGVLAMPSDLWVAVLIAGYGVIAIFNQARMSKCPRCSRPLNGAIAITTDRCDHCGEIAIDDPRP
jgi:hypothetical protein